MSTEWPQTHTDTVTSLGLRMSTDTVYVSVSRVLEMAADTITPRHRRHYIFGPFLGHLATDTVNVSVSRVHRMSAYKITTTGPFH